MGFTEFETVFEEEINNPVRDIEISKELAAEFDIEISTQSIIDILRQKSNEHIEGDHFNVVNIKTVVEKYQLWKEKMPRVQPFYAIKCNPDVAVIKVLAELGANFDCASQGEMQLVLSLGIEPNRIVFANPTKQPSHIRFAADNGIELMTFDNENELKKIKEYHPSAKAILRVLTDDSRSICRFGAKFGASPKITRSLMMAGVELGVDIVGVSFHVGSGCYDASAFTDALIVARRVFDEAEDLGLSFSILDIGGGFPGLDSDTISFNEVSGAMTPKLDELFPKEIEIIAEPGRFFVAACYTLVCSVIARRDISKIEQEDQEIDEALDVIETQSLEYLYYINDGVYGSFNNIMYDHAIVHPIPLDPKYKKCKKLYKSTVFGPTCDSIDCVSKNEFLPELQIGDWVFFPEMGAYTSAAGSCFNGFDRPKKYLIFT